MVEAVAWLRTQTDLPICVGFGISGPDQVRQLVPVADGLIVGSAIVRRLSEAASRPRAEVVQRDRPVRRRAGAGDELTPLPSMEIRNGNRCRMIESSDPG